MTTYKVIFKWNEVKQNTFKDIKRIVANNTLLADLDFNTQFEIHANARNFELGAVIIQEVRIDSFLYQETYRTSKNA